MSYNWYGLSDCVKDARAKLQVGRGRVGHGAFGHAKINWYDAYVVGQRFELDYGRVLTKLFAAKLDYNRHEILVRFDFYLGFGVKMS